MTLHTPDDLVERLNHGVIIRDGLAPFTDYAATDELMGQAAARIGDLEEILDRLRNPTPEVMAAACEANPERPYGAQTTLFEIVEAELKAAVRKAEET